MNIYLEHGLSNQTVAHIREMLDRYAETDPNFNGQRFAIYRDDFTWIDSDDAGAVSLYAQISSIMDRQATA